MHTEITFHAGQPLQKDRGWACVFESRRGERVCGTITTAALWDTREQALQATQRAMQVIEATGQWPNFCAAW